MQSTSSSSSILSQSRVNTAVLSLVVGGLVTTIKLTAWYLTGSSAIMSDAFESFINVATALLALMAIKQSIRPADETHPYGHGKIEFFSSGVEGALILLAGIAIVLQSFNALISGVSLHQLDTGILILSAGGGINLLLGLHLVKKGKTTQSEALVASGHHVLSDVWTTLGVVIGVTLVLLSGITWLDPVCAIVAGLLILRSGYQILRRSIGWLLDEADPEILGKISQLLIVSRKPGWIAPHRLRAWKSGSLVRIDFHLILPYYWTLEKTHDVEHDIHDIIEKGLDFPTEVIIHTEPCYEACCSFCSLSSCDVRKHPYQSTLEWTQSVLEADLPAQLKQ